MPARIVRKTPRDTYITAIVETDGYREGRIRVDRWHLILRPQADFNGRHVGYRVWIRRDDMLPETEAEALASACDMIEQLAAALQTSG